MKRIAGFLFTIASLAGSAQATESDGVTGLRMDVTSLLSMAGTWQPVDQQFISTGYDGGLANIFHGNFTNDSTGREHVIVTGWSYNPGATTPTPVILGIFQQHADGTMQLATSNFVSSSLTNGGGSVVVADFNGDGHPDIFLAPYNETRLSRRSAPRSYRTALVDLPRSR
jgi:hypothetical protein